MENSWPGASPASRASTLTAAELDCLKVEMAYPGVRVARDLTFEDVWALFVQSGFVYPEKTARLQPVMPQIRETMEALLAANGSLLTTVVLRDEHAMAAHISMLRSHERTIMVQHLAALPHSGSGLEASASVTLALAYYAQLREDYQWAKIFYRPNNPWPARVFGGFARQLKDTRTSDFRVFHYLSAPTSSVAQAYVDRLPVRAADESDWPRIEEWFVSRGRMVETMANDLQASRASLASVSERFRAAGLERRREALVADRDGCVLGFALLEISSLGLNFSELTNAFSVHLFEEDAAVHRALVMTAKRRYAEIGRPQCVALAEGADLALFEAAGFARVKEYACWTFARTHMSALEEYFATLFGAQGRRRA
jgi:hypothetical protein